MAVEQFSFGGNRRQIMGGTVSVGLVNNMPDAALRATELQFARLLKTAAGGLDVRLHLFSLKQIARSDAARARMEGFYADAASLPQAGLDALIVTGAEAQPGDLRQAPYWSALTGLITWAQRHTLSTVYSCLAAHAAVLHLDDIARVRLPQKLKGVFGSERVCEHPLFAGTEPIIPIPQSRHNGLEEHRLVARGYQILSRVPYGDADMFMKSGRSLSLFVQGHPEQDAESLGREFLHDTTRFLAGEDIERPAMPENYFDRATEAELHELAAHAIDDAILPRYSEVVSGALPLHTWRGAGVRLFGNWLSLVAAEKARRAVPLRTPLRRRARV